MSVARPLPEQSIISPPTIEEALAIRAISRTAAQELAKPEGLSPAGEMAYQVVMSFLARKEMTCAGGCKAFYTPLVFAARMQESVAHDAVLMVVHEGGDLAPVFNWDYQRYELMEELRQDLAKAGLWVEQQTSCFSAVFNS